MIADRPDRRLRRSERDRLIFGVCSGLGEYFDVDPVIFRLAFVLATITGGIGLLTYIILAILLPGPEAGGAAAAAPPAGTTTRQRTREIGGLILIALGLFFLARELGLVLWLDWDMLWPLMLIALGLALLWRRNQAP